MKLKNNNKMFKRNQMGYSTKNMCTFMRVGGGEEGGGLAPSTIAGYEQSANGQKSRLSKLTI